MRFYSVSERIEGKSQPPQSGWKIIPQSRTGGRETPITKFIMCSRQSSTARHWNWTAVGIDQRPTEGNSHQRDMWELLQWATDARVISNIAGTRYHEWLSMIIDIIMTQPRGKIKILPICLLSIITCACTALSKMQRHSKGGAGNAGRIRWHLLGGGKLAKIVKEIHVKFR